MSAVEFHLSEPVLRDYAADQLTDVDAWSVEAHLQRCRACQDRIVLRGPVADAVAAARMSLFAQLDASQRVPNSVLPDPGSPNPAVCTGCSGRTAPASPR